MAQGAHGTPDDDGDEAFGFVAKVLFVALILFLSWLAWRISSVFLIAFAGILFATILTALAEPLARRTGLRQSWAVVVVTVVLFTAVGAGVYALGDLVSQQLGEIWKRLPEALDEAQAWLDTSPIGRTVAEGVDAAGGGKPTLGQVTRAVQVTLGAVADMLLIIFLGVYFAFDPRTYRRGAVRLVPPKHRRRLAEMLEAAADALRRWLLGQLVSMTIVGVATGLGLWALGQPMALTLGLIAALLEFIPIIGPIMAALPAVAVALTRGPEAALYVVLLYTAVQQVESNLLQPLIQRWAVHVAPALLLLSVMAFGMAFGFLGAVLAAPLTVVVVVAVGKLYVEDVLENGG